MADDKFKFKAEVLKWTAVGMRSEGIGEYVSLRDAERIASEAFERGRKYGLRQAAEVLQQTPIRNSK